MCCRSFAPFASQLLFLLWFRFSLTRVFSDETEPAADIYSKGQKHVVKMMLHGQKTGT